MKINHEINDIELYVKSNLLFRQSDYHHSHKEV